MLSRLLHNSTCSGNSKYKENPIDKGSLQNQATDPQNSFVGSKDAVSLYGELFAFALLVINSTFVIGLFVTLSCLVGSYENLNRHEF